MARSILFVDQFREVAGGQVVLQALIEAARGMGWRVGVLAPWGGRLEADLRARWGGEIELHPMEELQLQDGRKGPGDLLRYLGFIFSTRRFRPLAARYETIYVNGGRLAPAFLFLSLFLPGRRWLYHVHLCHSKLEKLLLAAVTLAPTTHAVVAASAFIRADLVRSLPFLGRNRRLTVLENCLGPGFRELSFSNRQAATGPLRVALIGRVSPEKGHDLLPGLARRFPGMEFSIIGRTTPENEPFLRSIMDRAPRNLTYTGEIRDLPQFLQRKGVQISLMPSRWEEPFGLAAIESMAASCLTVVSNRGMLPIIAERTGAFCFRDTLELETILERIEAMSAAERAERARRQQGEAIRQFGVALFRRHFAGLFEAQSLGAAAPADGAMLAGRIS